MSKESKSYSEFGRRNKSLSRLCGTYEFCVVYHCKAVDVTINYRIDRQASEDVVVKGITINKGTCVTTDAWVIHRDPELWDDPETYNPDR